LSTKFRRFCKSCEQIVRNEEKNQDRAAAIMLGRARERAHALGVPRDFMWINMNWESLVKDLRVRMVPGAKCNACGHEYLNERDIQIEHRAPPRFERDWARERAENIALICGSCNAAKRATAYDTHLDAQEDARLSNEAHGHQQIAGVLDAPAFEQLALFAESNT
jgi:hypothetical protein